MEPADGVEGFDLYIRIPSDLFRDRTYLQAHAVLLPLSTYKGRSAGVYPPPRPIHDHPQPWALQKSGHWHRDRREGRGQGHVSRYSDHLASERRRTLVDSGYVRQSSQDGWSTFRGDLCAQLPGIWQQQVSYARDHRLRHQHRDGNDNGRHYYYTVARSVDRPQRRGQKCSRTKMDRWMTGRSSCPADMMDSYTDTTETYDDDLASCLNVRRMQTDEHVLHADKGGGGGGKGGVRRRGGGMEGAGAAEVGGKGGGDMDELDGLIEEVARANDASVDPAQMLPHVRSSPCPVHIHRASPNSSPGLDPRYTTICHGGKIACPVLPSGLSTGKSGNANAAGSRLPVGGLAHSLQPGLQPETRHHHHHHRHHQRGQKGSCSECTARVVDQTGLLKDDLKAAKGGGAFRDPLVTSYHLPDAALLSPRGGGGGGGRLNDSLLSPRGMARPQHQRRLPPRLPGELATQDMVLTWLQHGSAPPGESHFPDLTRGAPHRPSARPVNPSAVSE